MAVCNSACATSPLRGTTSAMNPAATRNGWSSATRIRYRLRSPAEAMAAYSDRAAAWISESEETNMTTTTPPGATSPVVSGTTPLPPKDKSSISSSNGSTLAGNFQSFLTLLTTQLKNQNPLDPLDTNQFTQQLVQFAGVEQQLKTNDQLTSLISLQKTAQSTQALGFVGKTAIVDGKTATLANGQAVWDLSLPADATVHMSITNTTGQTVFAADIAVNAGSNQPFGWDGKGSDGTQ